jgi:hypothetical protein
MPMKLAIMQPYFMPYIGYFSLIKHTDRFVVFDTVQYINKGWINRNRIISESPKGFTYMTVPVKKLSRKMFIKDTLIDLSQKWKKKIRGQLAYYKKKAPFYFQIKNLMEDILMKEYQTITELNVEALSIVCKFLDMPFKYTIFSQDRMGINSVNAPDEWALEICKKMGATTYVNPPGGKSFFNKDKYEFEGVDLNYLIMKLIPYKSVNGAYIPGLSIVDVLMFNDIDQVHMMMDSFELE